MSNYSFSPLLHFILSFYQCTLLFSECLILINMYWSWSFYTFGPHCLLSFLWSNSLALCRFFEHWRSVRKGKLWTAGSDSGSTLAQWEHWTFWRRPRENHHIWLWGGSLLRQPSHPVPSFWRFETSIAMIIINKKLYNLKEGHPKILLTIY